MNKPDVRAFFDDGTNTISYVVSDPATAKCAVIDSVLDYDAPSGRTSTRSADRIIDFVKQEKLSVEWLIDSHVHADHLTGALYIKRQLGGKTAIGGHITDVQKVFGEIFNESQEFYTDGRQFDHLFMDGDRYSVGDIIAQAIHAPGHTPACMVHVIGDAAFVGDTLFMPDFGTARCDFPGGDARDLYLSIQKIYQLPDDTRLFMCHDYKAPGRDEFAWESTVGEQKRANVQVHAKVSEEDFVELRTTKDQGLGMPRLIIPSLQVNMRAGDMPEADETGKRFFKVPINVL